MTRVNKWCMQRICIVFISLSATGNCFAGGLSAWEKETRHGNRLYHDGTAPPVISFTFQKEIPDSVSCCAGFSKFFFHNNYLVASAADTVFYVINETQPNIEKFHNEVEFQNYLKEKNIRMHSWEGNTWGNSLGTALLIIFVIAVCILSTIVYGMLLLVRLAIRSLFNDMKIKKSALLFVSIGIAILLLMFHFVL